MDKDFEVRIFPRDGGCVAAIRGIGFLAPRPIDELRKEIHGAVEAFCKANRLSCGRLEFTLSNDLRPEYPACAECKGSGLIKANYPPAAYAPVRIDLAARAEECCPACEGMGVRAPGFGRRA